MIYYKKQHRYVKKLTLVELMTADKVAGDGSVLDLVLQ